MKAYYCPGTHWDREWYETFQEFRMWLVELVDDLIDLMERDPEYACFHLDGQAVVLEDYLEVRPERRERLLRLLRERRILAGPWYVLPDEWLVSGESFIRNLVTGMRVCRDIGFEPMDFAYTPDQFGHIAALPMIMTGLGLRAGICWRGAQDEDYPAHFVWVGPDGSRMPTTKLIDKGSYAPFMAVRHALKEGDDNFGKKFEPYLKEEHDRSALPLVLMLDAIDHHAADPAMVGIMRELKRRYPDVEFVWGGLDQYGAEVIAGADKLPERSGELRQPCRSVGRWGQYLIVHTISSRYPLKNQNDRCQTLLERWVEPYALFETLSGGAPILRYLDLAWKYLLKNHPHDSICGCSIDQVHRDMMYRFDQCREIGEGALRRAFASTALSTGADEAVPNLIVHNPLPFARKGVFELDVLFRGDWQHRFVDGLTTGDMINKFKLARKDGTRLPFQFSRITPGTLAKRIGDKGRFANFCGDVYRVAVEMELPPCGFTALTVQPTDDGVRNFGTLRTGPLSASNGVVAVDLNPDGAVTLRHEASRREFAGLFLYEDCGDVGDGWTRGQMINDLVARTPGTRVTTAIEEDGPLRTVFRVEREFDLPRSADSATRRRSDDRTTLRVTDLIYIEKGADTVRVRSRIENTITDHRFRVLFPSGIAAERSFADTPFAVVERDIAIPPESATWQERVNPETAFTSFFGVQDDAGGFAVLAPFGLHEYEVTETPERSLALTLLRTFFRTVGTAGEPDGQLLGTHEFEYHLYPFAGKFDAARALRLVAEAQAGIRSHHVAELPDDQSFLRVEGDAVVVSAVKPADDGNGGVLRLWNPGDAEATARIVFAHRPAEARLCNLAEAPAETLRMDKDGALKVTVPARGLLSVRLAW